MSVLPHFKGITDPQILTANVKRLLQTFTRLEFNLKHFFKETFPLGVRHYDYGWTEKFQRQENPHKVLVDPCNAVKAELFHSRSSRSYFGCCVLVSCGSNFSVIGDKVLRNTVICMLCPPTSSSSSIRPQQSDSTKPTQCLQQRVKHPIHSWEYQ